MHTTVKFITAIPFLLLTAACSVQQQNGNDIRLEQPFVLSNQQWKITRQATTPAGDRVCTVSSGELDVTQRSHNESITQQVGISNTLAPGNSYKVLAGDRNYETLEGWFNPADSQAIIKYMMTNDIVYTETRVSTIELYHAGPNWRSVDNKIPTNGFAKQYHACEHFMKS